MKEIGERAVEQTEVAAVGGPPQSDELGQLALVPPGQEIDARVVGPRLPSETGPAVELAGDVDVRRLGVVEDEEAGLIDRIRRPRLPLGCAVVAGQGVGIAEEERVGAGKLRSPVEMITE